VIATTLDALEERPMRIADLDRSLPNGFHDATLHSISARPDEGILEFGLQVSIGDPEGTPEEQERYRPARLVLTGVTYFFIDPPGSRRDTWASRASRIGSLRLRSSGVATV
jgi:hypothetical protein